MIFMHFLAPFIVQHLKKILEVEPELWRYVIFGPKIASLSGKIFSFKTQLIIFITMVSLGVPAPPPLPPLNFKSPLNSVPPPCACEKYV